MDRLEQIIKIADELAQKIKATPIINQYPKQLSEVLFQHHSPHKLSVLSPQSYSHIAKERATEMKPDDVKLYINDRMLEEDKYRKALNLTNKGKSFTYASVVGFNLMEDALDYPGFTYFFHLNKQQIEKTLFGIVGGKSFNIEPAAGLSSLEKCLSLWRKHKDKLVSYEDDILGWIDPRIEVVIPYIVIPELVVVEVEQR